ncbi:MAG: hypothetical protein IKP29_09885 [Pseudobutyrivibrio sp.]|nr:hypothetical protein [Pseudobutyrivibrio sp.]
MSGIFTKKIINLTLIAALAITAFSGCGHPSGNSPVTSYTGSAIKKTSEEVEQVETVAEDTAAELYIVENLDMTEETISLYSVSTGKQLKYNYNMTTKFLDKYGKNSFWASFTTGTVVSIGELLPSSRALSEVQKSDSVWTFEELSKYKIDTEKKILTIDGSNYKITDTTKVYSDTAKIPLENIGKDDIITVVGKDKEVISIAITTGHGYIHLTGTSLFDNSMIFIGRKIVSTVYSDEMIEVPEGTYKVTVANNGWGGSGEYPVKRNEITTINLEDLKGEGPSYCLLTFLVTVPDTYVYLDGKQVDVTEPSYVQYGAHKLVVKCDGYNTWNKTLVVNSKEATITLEMESEDGTTVSEPLEQNTQNPEEGQQENEQPTTHEEETAGSSIKDDYDYEVDYLSTISDLISNLMN